MANEDIFKHLDEHCYKCAGTGKGLVYPKAECDICYGTDYQPTRAGIELLNFFRRQKRRIEREQV